MRPFGTPTITGVDPAAAGRYLWTGREADTYLPNGTGVTQSTGLQYNRGRFYSSSMARWISQDPLGLNAGDSNLYRYVNNDPTTYTDPSGYKLNKIVDLGPLIKDWKADEWVYQFEWATSYIPARDKLNAYLLAGGEVPTLNFYSLWSDLDAANAVVFDTAGDWYQSDVNLVKAAENNIALLDNNATKMALKTWGDNAIESVDDIVDGFKTVVSDMGSQFKLIFKVDTSPAHLFHRLFGLIFPVKKEHWEMVWLGKRILLIVLRLHLRNIRFNSNTLSQ